jgi:hypothetical protein
MDSLTDIVRDEVQWYQAQGHGLNCLLYAVCDETNHRYTVISLDYPTRKAFAQVVVLARVVGGQVVIEEDAADKKLVDKLVRRGVPRDHIILAYQGEPIPEAAALQPWFDQVKAMFKQDKATAE